MDNYSIVNFDVLGRIPEEETYVFCLLKSAFGADI